MNKTYITANNLSKSFEDKEIIKNLSFVINRGDLVKISGSNGAGKSTLLKIIARIYNQDSGEIKIEGKNINRIFNSLNSNEVFYDANLLDKGSTKLLKNKFEIPITIRVFSKNDKLGKPMYCYNIKGICVNSIRIECIKDIKIKNTYITVIPHIKKCSEIIENYL